MLAKLRDASGAWNGAWWQSQLIWERNVSHPSTNESSSQHGAPAAEARQVLDFWFGQPGDAEYMRSRGLWFKKSVETDALIRNKFGELHTRAAAGACDGWLGSPHGALALIIVLDQFSRNLYRDTARAFACDAQALAHAKAMVAAGADLLLQPIERWFIYMPYEHSESLAEDPALAETPKWAKAHYDIVKRFGRFPHRNALLGRPSTDEETAFLKQPGSSF
jgi:uncharacterized protein (DUF924 family)